MEGLNGDGGGGGGGGHGGLAEIDANDYSETFGV